MSQQGGPTYLDLPPREIFVATRGKSGEDETPSHANLGSKPSEKAFYEPNAPRFYRDGGSKPAYFTFEGLTPDSTIDDERDEQENVQMLLENDPVKVIRNDLETHDREMDSPTLIKLGSSGMGHDANENASSENEAFMSTPTPTWATRSNPNSWQQYTTTPTSHYYSIYDDLEEEVPFDEDPISRKVIQNENATHIPQFHQTPMFLPDRISPSLTPIIEVNSPVCSPHEGVNGGGNVVVAAIDDENEPVENVPTLEDTHVSSREEGLPHKLRGPIYTSQSLLDQEVVEVPSYVPNGPCRSESSEGSSCEYAPDEFCRQLQIFQFFDSLENDHYED